jgi:hypothetical protein
MQTSQSWDKPIIILTKGSYRKEVPCAEDLLFFWQPTTCAKNWN